MAIIIIRTNYYKSFLCIFKNYIFVTNIWKNWLFIAQVYKYALNDSFQGSAASLRAIVCFWSLKKWSNVSFSEAESVLRMGYEGFSKGRSHKKIRDYLGIFPNIAPLCWEKFPNNPGVGVPDPKTSVIKKYPLNHPKIVIIWPKFIFLDEVVPKREGGGCPTFGNNSQIFPYFLWVIPLKDNTLNCVASIAMLNDTLGLQNSFMIYSSWCENKVGAARRFISDWQDPKHSGMGKQQNAVLQLSINWWPTCSTIQVGK